VTEELDLIRQDMNNIEERRKNDSTNIGRLDKKVGDLKKDILNSKDSHTFSQVG